MKGNVSIAIQSSATKKNDQSAASNIVELMIHVFISYS